MSTLAHPGDLALADDVLREQDPDPQRVLLWLRGDRDDQRQAWQRVSGHLLARVDRDDGVQVVPVRVSGFRQEGRTDFRRVFDRFWSRQRQQTGRYILPTGDWVEPDGPSRGDALLAWSDTALDDDRVARLWPDKQECRHLGPNLVLVLGVEPPAAPAPPVRSGAAPGPDLVSTNGTGGPTVNGFVSDAELQRRLEERSREVRTLARRGQHEEALAAAAELLEWARGERGPTHPWVATCLLLIAHTHQQRGEDALAEPLYREALAIPCPVLGDNHPNFATALNNLAVLYQVRGQYADAEPLHRQALQVRRTALQETHPLVATSMNNLGLLYHASADTTAAEPLLLRALEIFRTTLGNAHPDVAICLENVAAFYESLGDGPTARSLAEQAQQVRQAAAGTEQVLVADTLNVLLAAGPRGTAVPAAEVPAPAPGGLPPVEDEGPLPWLPGAVSAEASWDETLVPGDFAEPVSTASAGTEAAEPATPASGPVLELPPVSHSSETVHPPAEPGTDSVPFLSGYGAGPSDPDEEEPAAAVDDPEDRIPTLPEVALPVEPGPPDAEALQAPSPADGFAAAEAPNEALPAEDTGAALPAAALWAALQLDRESGPEFDLPPPAAPEAPPAEAAATPSDAPEETDEDHVETMLRPVGAVTLEVPAPVAEPIPAAPPTDEDRSEPLVVVDEIVPPVFADNDAPDMAAVGGEPDVAPPDATPAEPPPADPFLILEDSEPTHPEGGLLLDDELAAAETTPAVTEEPPSAPPVADASEVVPPAPEPPADAGPLPPPPDRATVGEPVVPEVTPPAVLPPVPEFRLAPPAGAVLPPLAPPADAPTVAPLSADAVAVVFRDPEPPRALPAEDRDTRPDDWAGLRDRALGHAVAERTAEAVSLLRGLLPPAESASDGEDLDLFLSLVWSHAAGTPAAVRSALDAVLRHRAARFAADEAPEAGPREIAQRLPAGSALVEFVRFRPFGLDGKGTLSIRYIAFVVPAGEPDRIALVDLGEAAALDRRIAEFRAWITGEQDGERTAPVWRPPAAREVVPAAAAGLRAAVFDPLAAALGGRTRLFLAPAGNLACLPLAALPQADGRPLLETHQLSYVDSGLDVLYFGVEAEEQPGPPVVAADPDFDLYLSGPAPGTAACRLVPLPEAPRFERLTGTRRAGKQFAARLGVEPWLSGTVRRTRVLGLHAPRLLHLATHCVFAEDVPGGAALALAGANGYGPGCRPSAGADNGLLTAAEVAALDLRATELVVLPACDTGPSAAATGTGLLALQRAFLQAGAAAVVASLWKVTDYHVKELLSEFYERVLAGEPRAEALRQAQLAVRGRYPDRPEYWGAFVCHGDPGPLRPLPGARKKGKGGLFGALRRGR
jgi:tetratricopeptide (TPR) repeat protein